MADVARLVTLWVRVDESVVIGRAVELLSRMVCWRLHAYQREIFPANRLRVQITSPSRDE
jgi:hypothetical protein